MWTRKKTINWIQEHQNIAVDGDFKNIIIDGDGRDLYEAKTSSCFECSSDIYF